MKKSILFVLEDINKTGSPQTVLHYVETLCNRFDIDLLVTSVMDNEIDLGRMEEFKKYCRNIFTMKEPHFILRRYKIFYHFVNGNIRHKINDLLSGNKYEYVYFNRLNLVDTIVPLLTVDTKLVFNALGNMRPRKKSKYSFINKRKDKQIELLKKNVYKYIAISEQSILEEFDDVPEVIKVIHDYPILKEKTSTKAFHPKGKIVLGQIGYYVNNKNQLFSLSILNELINRGIDCEIKFIGFETRESNDYFSKMKKFISENGLENRVTFLNKDYDKNTFFDSVDLTLLPSYQEGFPLVLIESQIRKTPCLTSSFVTDESNYGLLHKSPINDYKLWADYIQAESYKKNTNISIDLKKKFGTDVIEVFD